MAATTYTLHRAEDDRCVGQRADPAALVSLAELAGRGRYYVHNGVGVVAACEVTAAHKTVAADRTPFMARKAAAIEARRAFGVAGA